MQCSRAMTSLVVVLLLSCLVPQTSGFFLRNLIRRIRERLTSRFLGGSSRSQSPYSDNQFDMQSSFQGMRNLFDTFYRGSREDADKYDYESEDMGPTFPGFLGGGGGMGGFNTNMNLLGGASPVRFPSPAKLINLPTSFLSAVNNPNFKMSDIPGYLSSGLFDPDTLDEYGNPIQRLPAPIVDPVFPNDFNDYRDQDIAVIGGGNTAFNRLNGFNGFTGANTNLLGGGNLIGNPLSNTGSFLGNNLISNNNPGFVGNNLIGGNNNLLGGNTNPLLGGNANLLGGNNNLLGGNTNPLLGGNNNLLGGNANLLGGNINPLGGNTNLLGGNNNLLGGNTNLIGGNINPLGGNANLISGNNLLNNANPGLLGNTNPGFQGNANLLGGNTLLNNANPTLLSGTNALNTANQLAAGNLANTGALVGNTGQTDMYSNTNTLTNNPAAIGRVLPGSCSTRASDCFCTLYSRSCPSTVYKGVSYCCPKASKITIDLSSNTCRCL